MTSVRRVRLGEVAREVIARSGIPQTRAPVFGVEKGIGLTAEPRYQSKDLSRYKTIEPGMFGYNPMRLNIGSIGYCMPHHGKGLISPDYIVFACNSEHLLSHFFHYHTHSRPWREWLALAGEGSVRERIYFRKLAAYEFELPDPGYQCATVQILSALDRKIHLNRRMNATLEALAQAIFKDWFVDFGPTRAKMEGRAPYLAPEIWSLFPDQLDGEEKPLGWSRRPLDQIADFLNGLALQKFPATGLDFLPVIKISQLRAGVAGDGDRASTDIPSQYVIDDGDVLFSWSGSLLHQVWTGGRGALNQHLFKVTSEKFPKWLYFHWIAFHMESFRAIAASKATTMGHIQRHHLAQAMTIIPDERVLKVADETIGPLFERRQTNDLEARTLARIRDLLLPKLMSGEIRMKDAEKIAELAA